MKRTTITLLAALLVGCGSGAAGVATPTTEGVAQSAATATTAPTQTSAPTATPEPTSTVEPTPTLEPTATAEPSATPEPTPAPDYLANPPGRPPSPGRTTNNRSYPPGAYEFIHDQFSVPAPVGRVPDEFVASLPGVEPGKCPLTGEPAPEGVETRRPINVRIDNSPQGRPQAGLEGADVVWEAMSEGGVTRLTATFHCRPVGTVGPIRSARLVDLQLTPMLQAWLVHVGASQQVTDMIWSSPYAARSINEWAGDPAFYRISQAPVNWLLTYSRGELIQNVIAGKEDAALPTPIRGWQFTDAVPAGSTGAAQSVYIPYQAGSTTDVSYRYNPATGRYLRYQGQNPHTTQAGAHLAADNVIVIFSEETTTPIVEDSLGSRSLHYRLHGQGRALLFRDGAFWDARWIREGENTLIRVVDAGGQLIPLGPGQSWVQIVRSDLPVSWQ